MSDLIAVFVQLGVNKSIAVMFVLFVGTYWWVKFFALNKLSHRLVERDRRILGRQGEIAHLRDEQQKSLAQLQSEATASQIAASRTFNEIKFKAAEKQRAVVGAAKAESMKMIQQARDDAAKQLHREIAKLESEIPALARQIVEQIMASKAKATQRTYSDHVS